MLKIDSENSYYQFDQWGMLIVPTDSLSHRDSIGRTVMAWIAYGKPEELKEAVNDCYHPNHTKPKYRLRRHPARCDIASRDHWSYWIILQKLTDSSYGFNTIIDCLPRMRGMNLWMKSLTDNKPAERFYYLIYIPGAIIGNIWLKFCREFGLISYEWDNNDWIDDFVGIPNSEFLKRFRRTKWQKIWAWIIFQTMPAYSLHNKAWQIYVMPDSKRKERLKRILLKRVGKSNIMLRLLFEPKVIYNTEYLQGSYKLVTQEEVDSYPHMTGYRPGVYLDETCRRTIRELTAQEAEFNTYERDLILWLWTKKTNS